MKKLLLIISVFTALNLNAQILNSGFETWITDTAYFDGFNGIFPKDTFGFSDPEHWTTTNALSGTDTFGALFLVTDTLDAHSGTHAMRLTTARFDTISASGLTRALTIPGLAVNGVFPLNIPTNTLLLGGTISPVLIPGAGTPFSQRLATIKGWYKYAPVFNDSTQSMDTCMVWATLKRGSEIVANAIFKSNVAASTYTQFSEPFTYVSCSIPDTLVILISSSVPTLGSLLTGTTPLVPGSVFTIDDLEYDTLLASYAFAPIARNDSAGTLINTAVTINVKANDDDCNVGTLAAATVTPSAAINGTTSVTAGNVVYTPSTGFVGTDTFTYTLSDGALTSAPAIVIVTVGTSGISQVNEIPVTVYPVPASDVLNIQFENTGRTTLRVFDVTGKLVLSSVFTKNNNVLNIADLANGIYGMQLVDEKNAVVARSKFTVSK